jgi:hypothetical protein
MGSKGGVAVGLLREPECDQRRPQWVSPKATAALTWSGSGRHAMDWSLALDLGLSRGMIDSDARK